MRSRADRRGAAERLARWGAIALLVASLWRAIAGQGEGEAPRLHAHVAGSLSVVERDSLRAIARAGVRVTWSGEVAPIALMTEPVREPTGGWRVAVASDAPVALTDSLGAIDSLAHGSGLVTLGGGSGAMQARAGATVARGTLRDAAFSPRVLVIARAGWESKFVVAALEEGGWSVDARIVIGQGVDAVQGSGALAGHAVVVVLDTGVAPAPGTLDRFVRSGGGLILGGGARRHGPRGEPVPIALADTTLTIAARRVGAGRILEVAEPETWRLRMQGEEGGASTHRAFWSRAVGLAAGDTSSVAVEAEEALPRAQVIQALGPPSAAAPGGGPRGPPLPLWLAPLILALLLTEWALRRLRGAA